MAKKSKSTEGVIPLSSGDWDKELLERWRALNLSANSLWMAELKMHLFGRECAYDYLNAEASTSGCVQFTMF